VRCDAVCEKERLRNSALTAGKQLKRLAPLRAKTTSSRAHRPPFIDYQRPRRACGAPHRRVRTQKTSREGHLAFCGPKRGHRNESARVLQGGHAGRFLS
jgi:hypothetical protein